VNERRRHAEQHRRRRGDAVDVTREEYNTLVCRVDELSAATDLHHETIERNQRSLTIQFERIAQLQIQLDKCVEKIGLAASRPPKFEP